MDEIDSLMNTENATPPTPAPVTQPPAAVAAGSGLANARMTASAEAPLILYSVVDKSCIPTHPIREHQIQIGPGGQLKSYQFKWDHDANGIGGCKPIMIPMLHALQFARHEGFEVRDENGILLDPTPETVLPNQAAMVKPGEVVARIDELSNEALLIRCRQNMKGLHITERSPRHQMLQFLAAQQAEKLSRGRRAGVDDIADFAGARATNQFSTSMSRDELERMMG